MNPNQIALLSNYREQVLDILRAQIGKRHATVHVFGSRARGNPRVASDIDLAVDAGPGAQVLVSKLRAAFEESTLPYSVDVVDMASCSPLLSAEVFREGVELWTS